MREYGYLLMVSDGSVHYILSMSFGWILATLEGDWLAAANGPSMGRGSSLHAEGDGMLSGLLFLLIVADKNPSEQCKVKYILDTFGPIQQNFEHLEYDIPYPNTTLRPEYVIIEKIYWINKEHNIIASLMWVKGHQD